MNNKISKEKDLDRDLSDKKRRKSSTTSSEVSGTTVKSSKEDVYAVNSFSNITSNLLPSMIYLYVKLI